GKCRGKLRHAAELKDVYVLVGIEAVFLHEIAKSKICGRAEAGDTDGFSLQVGHTFYFWERHHVKRGHIGYAADEDEVGAAKNRTDHRGSPGERDLRVAGEDDSGDLKRGGNVDQFDIEAIFGKEILLRGIPERGVDSADGRINDVQFHSSLRPG